MISAAADKLRRLVHRYRRRFAPGAAILLYHRVIELPSDPYLLSVSPSHFAEHLAVLRKHTRPMSLRQLVRGLHDGKVPRRAVVITMDDGYFDNLVYAKPLLEQYDTPATVFVTPASCPDAADEFWWDALEKILLRPRSLPQNLRLLIGGVPHEWRLGSAAEYGPDDHTRHCFWNYGMDDPTPRHAIFRSIHQLLKPLNQDERGRILRDLTAWASAETTVRSNYRALSGAETIRLAEGGLVEVGAHTMTHPVLSRLTLAEQRQEIRQSKAYLEGLAGQKVTSFAYPHGLHADYSQETIALVRESGFECACVATPGRVRCGVDVHQLPRFVIRDETGDSFAERLSTLFYD